jgi:hypothetical protein
MQFKGILRIILQVLHAILLLGVIGCVAVLGQHFRYDWKLIAVWILGAVIFIFWLYTGKGKEEAKGIVRRIAVQVLQSWCGLMISTAVLTVLLIGGAYVLLHFHLVGFKSTVNCGSQLYEHVGNVDKFLAGLSAETPWFTWCWSGDHAFVVKGDGLTDYEFAHHIPGTLEFPWSQEDIVSIPGLPILSVGENGSPTISSVDQRLDNTTFDTDLKTSMPNLIVRLPSVQVSFELTTVSAIPLEATPQLKVVSRLLNSDWMFPYFDEPLLAKGTETNGLVYIDSKTSKITQTLKPKSMSISKGDGGHLNLRLCSEGGWQYKLRLDIKCHDPHMPQRADETIEGAPFDVGFPRDWVQLANNTQARIQIVYYYPIDLIAENILKQKLEGRTIIYVADPQSHTYVEKRQPVVPSQVKYATCEEKITKALISELGENQVYPGRPKNCVIFDSETMLVQDASSERTLSSGKIVKDKAKIQQVQRILSKVPK